MPRTHQEPEGGEPCGIIIQTGARKRRVGPLRAYLWSEEAEAGACAGASGGRILDHESPPDGMIHSCRASP